jgi:hypothetical protein
VNILKEDSFKIKLLSNDIFELPKSFLVVSIEEDDEILFRTTMDSQEIAIIIKAIQLSRPDVKRILVEWAKNKLELWR